MMKKIYFLVIVFLGFFANAQVINFTDANFKTRLLQATASGNVAVNLAGQYFRIDSNFNNEIEVSEALQVKELYLDQSLITNLAGIGNFINLYKLNCSGNNIPNLDLEGLPNLFSLSCYNNNMNTININGLSNLFFLNCGSNNLSTIDFSQTPHLSTFHCGINNFTSFDLSGLNYLYRFDCNSNDVSVLYNLEDCTFLEDLFIDSNLFTSIDLSVLPALMRFYGSYNLFSTIDLSNNPLMNTISLHGNPNLSSFFCKNGVSELFVNFENCPNLHYICSDDFQTEKDIFNTKIAQYGYNCELNSYCSFTPGGEYFTVNGQQRFDSNSNGCEETDLIISNLRINQLSNGNIIGSYINNNSGNYSIPTQAGNYTFTPVMQNPSYFNISPSSFNVSFPTDVSPITQNFCITPNGIHNNLEIIVLPISPARPGFDANYKITYKNNGNLPQSGVVSLTFNDLKTDFISSFPLLSSQIDNVLTWDYANLLPFETREIDFILNINSPMETPAVNVGDQISFTATIDPTDGDEYLNDNTSRFKQTIVGSIDPNDKTCIEGNVVGSEMIGDYVHYIIRFENTGTFAAENIVVSDEIDSAKFDVSSLVPTNSNYPFVTRINNNKVEFIFEGINLPFDDTTNDGYVAFKIKTLPSLVVGNTFSNKANIYFDYNFPIETNTASTSIQVLGNIDFEFSDWITLFPNPVKNVLNFNSKLDIKISSINIYNALGQLVEVATNPIESIDVSNLKTGNYFIKVITNKGTSNSKFIKE